MHLPRIEEMRLERGLNQSEMAAVLGISQTVYARCERGDREVSADLLVALADYFETSTDYLLGRTDYPRMMHLK